MSGWLRLCLGLFFLAPSAVGAAFLGNPGHGLSYSGIGVISGWKCEAHALTVRFFDEDMLPVGDAVPLVYGTERPDVPLNSSCDNAHAGFVAIWNWENLGDGTYTAVASDAEVEFARSTFAVTTLGTELPTDASAQVSIPDFPQAGETTTFQWNRATRHLEAVARDPACRETLTMQPGETCRGSISLELDTSRLGAISTGFTFAVEAEGRGCIGISGIPALNYCYSTRMPNVLGKIGVSVTRNEDGSWTIDRFPLLDLGQCVLDLTVEPGAKCSGSIDLPVGDIDFTFSVEASGRGCIEAEVDVPLVSGKGVNACFDTGSAFQKVLDKIDDIIEISAFAAKNADGSWTILDQL